jgi:hypothetical protein
MYRLKVTVNVSLAPRLSFSKVIREKKFYNITLQDLGGPNILRDKVTGYDTWKLAVRHIQTKLKFPVEKTRNIESRKLPNLIT